MRQNPLRRPLWADALRTGLIFGVIEAITPVLGWALGFGAAKHVAAWDHWIAFVLLGVLGARMIHAGLQPAPSPLDGEPPARHSFWLLAATGLATSIDAMIVGVGLALLHVDIVPVAAAIGLATFMMATAGVMLGRVLGTLAGKRAEVIGGLVLIGLGTTILIQHLRAAGG